jgi:hypothetical protein
MVMPIPNVGDATAVDRDATLPRQRDVDLTERRCAGAAHKKSAGFPAVFSGVASRGAHRPGLPASDQGYLLALSSMSCTDAVVIGW